MELVELAFKIDGTTYEVKSLTLDDALLIDREFGVRDIAEFQWTRPAYLAALVYLGFREKNRFLSHEQLMEKVGAVDLVALADSILEAVQVRDDPPTPAEKAKTKRPAKAD